VCFDEINFTLTPIITRKWVFSTKVKDKTHTLKKHADTKIVRHIKVKGTKHVYDGDKVYWSVRGQKDPTISTSVRTLLKKQDGKCTWCNPHFRFDDVMEVDHIKPKMEGGKDVYIDNYCMVTVMILRPVRTRKGMKENYLLGPTRFKFDVLQSSKLNS